MKYTYETSYPWITFSASKIPRAGARFWAMLGECQSKIEHIAGVPLRPDVAQDFHRVYLAKGALATTAIEGNTLSEDEALKAVDGDLSLPPSREYLAKEIENVIAAFNKMFQEAKGGHLSHLTLDSIKALNKRVLEGLEVEKGVVPGEIRTHSVGVSRYRGAPPLECEYLVRRLCTWLASPEMQGTPGLEIGYAIIRSILAHLYIAWIHPFGDGNGRTARLVEYQILLSCGVPGPAIQLLSNHYNQTRTEYYRQLDRASGSGGDYLPFMEYALQGFVDGLRNQIGQIKQYQLDVVWANYVHELFDDRKSSVDRRRRDLVRDLTKAGGWVPIRRIREVSARMAEAYATRTGITLERDLVTLQGMGLVLKSKEGYRANKTLVEAFLPYRRPVVPRS